jgi:hypothetical protein
MFPVLLTTAVKIDHHPVDAGERIVPANGTGSLEPWEDALVILVASAMPVSQVDVVAAAKRHPPNNRGRTPAAVIGDQSERIVPFWILHSQWTR